MSAWDHHKTLSDFSAWAESQMKEAHDELRKKLLEEAPDDAADAVHQMMEQLEGLVSADWPYFMRRPIEDAEPPEDDPGYCENPRREHGTYFTSTGARAA